MSKEKSKKPRFKLNTVVIATGPTGDEVFGCVKESTAFGLTLRSVGDDGQIRNTHVPFRTYRMDEMCDFKGLEGVVECLRGYGGLKSPENVITWLSPESLVFARIKQDAVDGNRFDVVRLALSRQSPEQVERALSRDNPLILRRAALSLKDSTRWEAIARDKEETELMRNDALCHLKNEAIALEIALDMSESSAVRAMAMHRITSVDMLTELFCKASFAIEESRHLGRNSGPDYADRLSKIVLEGVHVANRVIATQRLVLTKDAVVIMGTMLALLQKTVIWDQDIAIILKHFIVSIEGHDDEPRLKIASRMLEIEGCLPSKSDLAFISLVRSLKFIDGIVELVERIRTSGKAHGLGLPPRAKITPACALQLIQEQGWYGDYQWEALLNRYRKPEDKKIRALIMAKKK